MDEEIPTFIILIIHVDYLLHCTLDNVLLPNIYLLILLLFIYISTSGSFLHAISILCDIAHFSLTYLLDFYHLYIFLCV